MHASVAACVRAATLNGSGATAADAWRSGQWQAVATLTTKRDQRECGRGRRYELREIFLHSASAVSCINQREA